MNVLRKTKLTFWCFFIFIMSFSFLSGNGLNLNSLGSRALSMGGAYIGLADDFSAIFWNPGGLTQVNQIIVGVYITDVIPSGSYKLNAPLLGLNIDAKTVRNHYVSGMVAYCRPITEKLVTGLAVYLPSGIGTEWSGEDLKDLSDGTALKWLSSVGIIAFSPVIAYKINDYFSIGATLNVHYGMMTLKLPAPEGLGQYTEDASGYGYGATIGILAKPSKVLSLGLTFKTANKITFEGKAKIPSIAYIGLNPESNFSRDITWPMWIGAGVAFKPEEELIFTADIQWTQWSKEKVIKTDYDDYTWQQLLEPAEADKMKFYWEDKMQIRFGVEYLLSKNITLRGGYYYDPAPAPDKTMNILLPTYTFNVLTFGLGYKTEDIFLDFGFEYLIGKERQTSIEEATERAMPGAHKMSIIVPNITITYRF